MADVNWIRPKLGDPSAVVEMTMIVRAVGEQEMLFVCSTPDFKAACEARAVVAEAFGDTERRDEWLKAAAFPAGDMAQVAVFVLMETERANAAES